MKPGRNAPPDYPKPPIPPAPPTGRTDGAENCDAKRLDWVIAQGEEFRCFNDLDAYQVSGRGVVIGHGKTAREAIDAARKAAE